MADRYLQQFTERNDFIREQLSTISTRQSRLGAVFSLFTLEFANLILPRPILPLPLLNQAIHGTALGHTFLLYTFSAKNDASVPFALSSPNTLVNVLSCARNT